MPTISTTNEQKKQIDFFGGMNKLIEAAKADKANDFELVPLDQIEPNPYQIRTVTFEDVVDLSHDIYANGLLQIPVGRRMPDGTTQQAFGHRRKTAHDLIVIHGRDEDDDEFTNWQQFTTMKMIIKPLTDMEMYLYMASENGQRENPNVMEVARSIKMGQEQFGLNQMDAAKPHGVTSSGNVSVLLSLLSLPLSVQSLIEGGTFGTGKNAGLRHGSQLVRLVKAGFEDNEIIKIAEQAAKQDMTVSTLQMRVDHEIKVRTQQTTKVNRHCPHCGGVVEVSEWQLQNEGAIFQRCARCGIKDYRLSGWFTPEKQAEKDKILAAVKQTSFMSTPEPEATPTPTPAPEPEATPTPTPAPEPTPPDADATPGELTMVQLEEVKKGGRKVKMFIRKSNDPAVAELAERLWDCLGDDDMVNMAAIFDVLFEMGWKETMEGKLQEAIGNELPDLMKARIIKKILNVL